MPILEVEVTGGVAADRRPDLARRLAEAAGGALASRPQGTWVRLRFLDERDYAETAGGPPPGVAPVFVSLLLASLPAAGDGLAELVARLAAAIAKECDRPVDQVHILVEPAAQARIAFGGRLQR